MAWVSRRIATIFTLSAVVALAALAGDGSAIASGPSVIERVGDGLEGAVAISADGNVVAFTDESSPTLTVIDRKAGTAQGLGSVPKLTGIDISADGRFVAFSTGQDLVPEDPPCEGHIGLAACADVYVYDRLKDTYELVSVAGDGTSAGNSGGWFDNIAMSADGRHVTFRSDAESLSPEGSGFFVRDLLLGTTVRIADGADTADITADGRFIAFGGFTDAPVYGVYVHDRDADEDGVFDEPGSVEAEFIEQGMWPAISDDGRFVAYYTNEIKLHDRQTGSTTIVTNSLAFIYSAGMALSADGRYLAYATIEAQVPQDTNGLPDVYLHDRVAQTAELVSVAADGSPGNGHSAAGFAGESQAMVALTPDARYAAFQSAATNFLPGEGAGTFVAGTSLLGGVDTDSDGCTNKRELGQDAPQGGQRNPDNFWDFFDTPGASGVRDRAISIGDLFATLQRFGSSGDPTIDPLSAPPPAPAYHTAFDRTFVGPDPWDLGPPDGSIDIGDVFFAVIQFGHSCV